MGHGSSEDLMYKLGCKQHRDGTYSPQDRMRSPGEKLKIESGDTPVLIGSEEEEELADELKGRIQGSRRIFNSVGRRNGEEEVF